MRNFIFVCLALIAISLSSCGGGVDRSSPSEGEGLHTEGFYSFIMNNGDEFKNLRTNHQEFADQDSLFIAVVVMKIGIDSVKVFYGAPEYGNGAYCFLTSLQNYNDYESHRIKTVLGANYRKGVGHIN